MLLFLGYRRGGLIQFETFRKSQIRIFMWLELIANKGGDSSSTDLVRNCIWNFIFKKIFRVVTFKLQLIYGNNSNLSLSPIKSKQHHIHQFIDEYLVCNLKYFTHINFLLPNILKQQTKKLLIIFFLWIIYWNYFVKRISVLLLLVNYRMSSVYFPASKLSEVKIIKKINFKAHKI